MVYNMSMERWKSGTNCIFNVGYHFIWCPKYRRKVLVDAVENRLKAVMKLKAKQLGVEIVSLEILPDHVHLFVKCKPTFAPHQLVKQFKGNSSRLLRDEFPKLKSRLPTLWTNSYYCESVGHISEATIKRYIEDQKNK
jgi:putative transposase